MKAVERINWLTHGTHSRSADKRSDTEIILNYLKRSGWTSQEELAANNGYQDDFGSLRNILRPLQGSKKSNPLNLGFIRREVVDDTIYYKLCKPTFNASMNTLRIGLEKFLCREQSIEALDYRELDQLLWLAYCNHQNTYRYRKQGRKVLEQLLNKGEMEKSELMQLLDLEPGADSDDQRFRRMMQYLRGSWVEEKKNPLHTENHAFLVSLTERGGEAFYRVNVREFRNSLNVAVKNIRDFLDDEALVRQQI